MFTFSILLKCQDDRDAFDVVLGDIGAIASGMILVKTTPSGNFLKKTIKTECQRAFAAVQLWQMEELQDV